MTAPKVLTLAQKFLSKGNLKKTREKLLIALDCQPNLQDLKRVIQITSTLLAFELLERKAQQKKSELLNKTLAGQCPKIKYLESLLNKGFL